MKRLTLFLLLFVSVASRAQQVWPSELLLTPEKSNFEKTSTYADVMAFLTATGAFGTFVVNLGHNAFRWW